MAIGSPYTHNFDAGNQYTRKQSDVSHCANHLFLCTDPLSTQKLTDYKLSSTKHIIKLFILLQLAYLIFLLGKLLEDLYSNPSKTSSSILTSVFFMITLILFMAVLWRHYQKDQCKYFLMQ